MEILDLRINVSHWGPIRPSVSENQGFITDESDGVSVQSHAVDTLVSTDSTPPLAVVQSDVLTVPNEVGVQYYEPKPFFIRDRSGTTITAIEVEYVDENAHKIWESARRGEKGYNFLLNYEGVVIRLLDDNHGALGHEPHVLAIAVEGSEPTPAQLAALDALTAHLESIHGGINATPTPGSADVDSSGED